MATISSKKKTFLTNLWRVKRLIHVSQPELVNIATSMTTSWTISNKCYRTKKNKIQEITNKTSKASALVTTASKLWALIATHMKRTSSLIRSMNGWKTNNTMNMLIMAHAAQISIIATVCQGVTAMDTKTWRPGIGILATTRIVNWNHSTAASVKKNANLALNSVNHASSTSLSVWSCRKVTRMKRLVRNKLVLKQFATNWLRANSILEKRLNWTWKSIMRRRWSQNMRKRVLSRKRSRRSKSKHLSSSFIRAKMEIGKNMKFKS